MNETQINNWNAKVGENDLVYVLGDMFWQEPVEEILNRLNGQIIYIYSLEHSHEAVLKYSYRFQQVEPLLVVKEAGTYITLCHYCLRTWPKSHYNHWHLYAHSHGRLPSIGKSHDVGVDANNFFPLTFEEISGIMDKKPDNPGYTRIRGFYRQKTDEEEK